MPLVIHDTLSGEKRPFEPRDPKRVTLYVCGPTVYNYAHIGNARPVVVFDVLFRLLRRLYGEDAVVYARNITDVDDKINAKAMAEGVDISVITSRFTAIYEADMAALGALPPTVQPRATQHIGQMLDQIAALIGQDAAYAAEGHVLFDTTAYARYGELSKRSLDDMIAGARVEVAPYKRNPADFVLWKPSKPGEPVWDSPWGPGRPGWHIECSAMSETVLGLPIDIHGGGHDLTFPHHENEIAQGVCAHGSGADADPRAYARYWMHNGFLTMDAEKMSKSLGNVLLVHDLIDRWPGEVIRWALLSGHYRAPLNWTDALLEQAKASLDRLYGGLQKLDAMPPPALVQEFMRDTSGDMLYGDYMAEVRQTWNEAQKPSAAINEVADRFIDALQNDLNTPGAQSILFELNRGLGEALARQDADDAAKWGAALRRCGKLIGFLQDDASEWFTGGAEDIRPQIEALMEARAAARADKDWTASDRLRAELTELGVEVLDGKDGATWRFKG